MKVKELIDLLNSCDENAEFMILKGFDYKNINTVEQLSGFEKAYIGINVVNDKSKKIVVVS